MADKSTDTAIIDVEVNYTPADNTTQSGSNVDTVTFYQQVNTIPYAEISLQASGDGKAPLAQKITEGLRVKQMEELQNYATKNRTTTSTVKVKLTGENSGGPWTGDFTFVGKPIAPSKTAGFGFVEQGIKLYGDEININALRPFIYGPRKSESNNTLTEEAMEDAPDSANILDRAVKLLEKRIENFESTTNLSSFVDTGTHTFARQINTVNKAVIPKLKNIVANSTEGIYESFGDLASLDPTQSLMIKAGINKILLESMLSCSGGFFDVMMGVLGSFQMFYAPDPTGKGIGSVRPYRYMVQDAEVVEKKVASQYISFSSEDYDYGPIQQVVVQGVFRTDLSNVAKEDVAQQESNLVPDLQTTSFVVWPETINVLNGNFRPVGPPPWMAKELSIFDSVKNPDANFLTEGWGVLDYVKEKEAVFQTLGRTLQKQYIAIIKEYAKNLYNQAALASYTAVIRCPIDFTWEVGTRYKVTDNKGEPMFNGFLTQASHSLSGIKNNLSAWSTLVFSHVEYGNFKL